MNALHLIKATVEPVPAGYYKSVAEIVQAVHDKKLRLPGHVVVRGRLYSVEIANWAGVHAIRLFPESGPVYQFEGTTFDKDTSEDEDDGWSFEAVHQKGGKILVDEINKNPRTGLQAAVRKLEACFD